MKQRIKKILSIGVFLMMAVTLVNQAGSSPMSRAADNLVTISTAEDFGSFIAAVHAGDTYAGKSVFLEADLVLDHTVVNLDVTGTGVFEGTLDGRGHTVTGINMAGGTNACLFNIGKDGDVRNLMITESYYTGTVNAAAIADTNDGIISNCVVHRTRINGVRAVGGLVCKNNGTIRNCACLDGTLKAEKPESYEEGCGGITMSNAGVVENSCNTSSVEAGGGITSIGGIVAYMENVEDADVFLCYSTAKLISQSKKGGIVGFLMNGSVDTCICSKESCEDICGDISLGEMYECSTMDGLAMLKPDFATALNAKRDPDDTELSEWVTNAGLGCVMPAFPGVLAPTPDSSDSQVSLPAPSGVKAKQAGKGKLKVTWKKVADADGYQVQVSYKKNFKKAKSYTTSKTKLVVKKLKKGKTVFVRVRGFVSDDDGPSYGTFSKKVKVKIKK